MTLVNKSQNLFIYFIYYIYKLFKRQCSTNGSKVAYLPENITDFNSLSVFKRNIKMIDLE